MIYWIIFWGALILLNPLIALALAALILALHHMENSNGCEEEEEEDYRHDHPAFDQEDRR